MTDVLGAYLLAFIISYMFYRQSYASLFSAQAGILELSEREAQEEMPSNEQEAGPEQMEQPLIP